MFLEVGAMDPFNICAERGSDWAGDLPTDPQLENIAVVYTQALKSLKLSKQGANESVTRSNLVAARSWLLAHLLCARPSELRGLPENQTQPLACRHLPAGIPKLGGSTATV